MPLCAFLAGLANCSWPIWNAGSINCGASIEPAVVVEIQDARTGVPLAEGARGVVRDGAYVDSLRPHAMRGPAPFVLLSRAAALERPGIYSVTVAAPGYKTWTLHGVVVRADECHVRTRRVHAGLLASS